jgi:hypothetical protein
MVSYHCARILIDQTYLLDSHKMWRMFALTVNSFAHSVQPKLGAAIDPESFAENLANL